MSKELLDEYVGHAHVDAKGRSLKLDDVPHDGLLDDQLDLEGFVLIVHAATDMAVELSVDLCVNVMGHVDLDRICEEIWHLQQGETQMHVQQS
jgi:hypothetical protein